MKTVTFNRNYFGFAVLIFVVEVLIALFVRDKFVRPYLGDVLVVILIYCFVRAFFDVRVVPLAMGVLFFAFAIEFLQYINIVDILGLRESKLASTVMGTSFAWEDILAYVAGIVIVLVSEKYLVKKTDRH
jgi:hypothetical protein